MAGHQCSQLSEVLKLACSEVLVEGGTLLAIAGDDAGAVALEHGKREGDEACVFWIDVLVHKGVCVGLVVLCCSLVVHGVCYDADQPDDVCADWRVVEGAAEDVEAAEIQGSMHVVM